MMDVEGLRVLAMLRAWSSAHRVINGLNFLFYVQAGICAQLELQRRGEPKFVTQKN